MFEKEAEEYAEDMVKYYESAHGSVPSQFEKYLRKAVEFGYNKANEWHFVKDGDLPKENQLVLLYRENPNGANVALAYWYKSYVNDKVIAWKKIVLPELKESE